MEVFYEKDAFYHRVGGGYAGRYGAGCKSKEDDKIIIGGLAPLTGNVAQYGQAVDNAVKMAIEEINEKGGILGKKIDYRSVDEKGDPTEAVNAYYSLVEEGIVALIGDVTSKPSKSLLKSGRG